MRLYPFKNQYRDHDFTLIANTIKDYFPVGKPKRLSYKNTASSPGFKKRGEIVDKEFLNQNAYRNKWGKLTSNIKKIFKKPVYGFPDMANGGFVGEIIIDEDKKDVFIRKKSLVFYVSIIGPFFSIHGVDSSTALLEVESRHKDLNKGNFTATNAITISPVFEYYEAFNKLEDQLRSVFPGYLFVPYDVGMSTMKNISTADELRDTQSMDTVYEALFGTRAVHTCLMRGDRYYGMSDWVKPLNQKEKSLLNLISQHIVAASNEMNINKVWKLQEAKRLDTFKVSGMFGIDLFDVIDLTDKSKLILISGKRQAPVSVRYRINKEVIEVNPNYSFRIIDLSKNTLKLHLTIHFENEKASVKGEAMEMKFVEMRKIE